MIKKQASFKLESIEDRMHSVGRNTRVTRADKPQVTSETTSESQFGEVQDGEDELMQRLREIEAEAMKEEKAE